jgi:Leucine-rich repeat (LRR) protein
MPSLEILDISRNKIKRLPSQPGSLATLRVRLLCLIYTIRYSFISLQVFCISKNKLTRLPSYLSNFRNLNIFKIDHNPLEWPPKVIMEPFGGVEDPQVMRGWIRTIQKWIDDNSTKPEARKASDGSFSSEQTDLDSAV